jgi:WD40 repeat protein
MSPTTEEPYVGLGHFTEAYADRFFGRDTECSLIIGNLRAARLTLLYAESGVGKSSALRAGVVAQLHAFAERDRRAGDSPRLVPVIFSSWTEAPVAGLIRAIGDAARPYLPDDRRLELPEDDLERALAIAGEALDATLLVVLDQFEEYFLYRDDQPEEKRVAAQIARCVNRPDLRANFLISIREDSYARLGDLFRGKVGNVYANFLHLDFLDRAGARESIEKPVARVNELSGNGKRYELEPALVEAVLDQVRRGRIENADDDGHHGDGDEVETTYLQLVMRRLWEEETRAGSHRLRLGTLEDLGGSQAVITSHLDRAMDDETEGSSLTAEQRLVAASIFHFLVTSGGTKIALTAKDLADLSERPLAEIEPVLRHLSSPALHILRPVVSENGRGEPRFEIFHDALARPIVEWRTRAEEDELNARVKRERDEKESAQRAAAAAEEREARERKRKRLALVLAGLAVVLLVLGVLYALVHQESVSDQREAKNQSVQAAARMAELGESPTFGPVAAALASVEDYDLSPTDEARNLSLSELQLNPGLPAIAVGHTRVVDAVSYWPDSSGFVTGGRDGTVRRWRPDGSEIGPPLVNPGTGVESIALTELPGGARVIAAGLTTGVVQLWTVGDAGEEPKRLRPLLPESGSVSALTFSPGAADILAVGGSSGRVSFWDLSKPSAPVPFASRQALGSVSDLAFNTKSGGLLVASSRAWQELWVTPDATELRAQTLFSGAATAVATAPDGSFAFGGRRGISLWDATRERERYLRVPGGVTSLAFARGGSVLVAGGTDLNVMTWDVASGRLFGPPRVGTDVIEDVAISPDEDTIAAVGGDRLVRLWPVEGGRGLARTVAALSPRETGSRAPNIAGLAVSEDGVLATAGGSAGTSLWRLDRAADPQSRPRPFARVPGASEAVAFHGDLLAVARGRSFVLEDTGSSCETMPTKPCQLAGPARPHSARTVLSLAFTEIGSRLVLASSGYREGEGLINLWDVTDAKDGTISHLSTRRKPTEIYQVALSPASPLLVAATEDGKLRVWDIRDPTDPKGITIADARGNEDQPVNSVAFSRDGKLLASGGGDQQVVLWNVVPRGSAPPKVEATPGTLFLTQTVFSLAFSPDGEYLAVGDGNGITCLYAVETRSQIGSCLFGHVVSGAVGIRAVAFAPVPGYGTALLTAGAGEPAVAWSPTLWNMGGDDRVEAAIASDVCALAGRNLTKYEWSAIFGTTNLADDRDKTCPQYPLPAD